MSTTQRQALFIDGANTHFAAKSLGYDINYKRVLMEIQNWGTLVRAFYYTVLPEDQEYTSLRPLIDWLDYNGYQVVTKRAREFTDATGRRKVRGSFHVELAVHALELAPRLDHMVLFSGDGDYRSLVEAVQRKGVRVTVVSTASTRPPMISDDLRRQADEFVDLAALIPKIARHGQTRVQRSPADDIPRDTADPARQLEDRYGIRNSPVDQDEP